MHLFITHSRLQADEVVGEHAENEDQKESGEDPAHDDGSGEAGVGVCPMGTVDAGEVVVDGDGDGWGHRLRVSDSYDAHEETRSGVAVLIASCAHAMVGVPIDHNAATHDLMYVGNIGGSVLIPSLWGKKYHYSYP